MNKQINGIIVSDIFFKVMYAVENNNNDNDDSHDKNDDNSNTNNVDKRIITHSLTL